MNRPQYYDSINLIEFVYVSISEKEPIFIGIISIPHRLNHLYLRINPQLQSCIDLVILTCVGILMSHEVQHTLIKKSVPGFPSTHLT